MSYFTFNNYAEEENDFCPYSEDVYSFENDQVTYCSTDDDLNEVEKSELFSSRSIGMMSVKERRWALKAMKKVVALDYVKESFRHGWGAFRSVWGALKPQATKCVIECGKGAQKHEVAVKDQSDLQQKSSSGRGQPEVVRVSNKARFPGSAVKPIGE